MLALLLSALVLPRPVPPPAETVTVTVLATTDTHGFLYPWDYSTRQPAPRGLAGAATLVAEVRRDTPHTLLVDCGDTIQGSPLESVHQAAAVRAGRTALPDPMMLAMNRMGYDAMVVGNHEFNFGLRNLAAARSAARFPWLVGVRRALRELERERPDVVVAAVHGGLDCDPRTGEKRPGERPGENGAWLIAERFPQTRPQGERVMNLRYRGFPLKDDQRPRLALNNYRAAGSAGYSMFRGAAVVWRSGREIRDLMVEYFGARKVLPAKPDGNWRLVPPGAVETLAREEAAR